MKAKIPREKLKKARIERHWSQARAADEIKVDRKTYHRWETGETDPHPYGIEQACRVFGKTAHELDLVDEIAPRGDDLTQQHERETPSEPVAPVFKSQSPPFDEGQLPQPEYFVGRSDDLEWVMQQIHAGKTTAITALNGLAGIGKTALAAVAVHKLRAENYFPDGIAVLFCIGQTKAVDILRRALGRFDPQRRQPETNDPVLLYEIACQLLKGKKALIVLDSIEPGLDIETVVIPLKGAGATLLLTSRQALPRSTVPVEASRLLELLSSEDALELFIRSLGHNNTRDLSPGELQAARRIVAVLDRHTLAVKLAGAYAADLKLDLDALASNLEQDPLDVPQGEIPRAVILAFSRSTEALAPSARRLFAALAAFATSGFSRNAALALAKKLGLTGPKENVDLLVLRALVSAYVDGQMPAESDRERLLLHPLLRAFAREKLKLWTESDRDNAYNAVALYYVTSFNKTTDKGLSIDEANIVGALEWAHSHAQDELVVTLCSGMQAFWLYRLRMSASQIFLPWGIAAANAIVEKTEKREDRLRAANLSLTYGQMLRYIGRVDEAEETLEKNLAIRREAGDRQGEEQALSALGQLYRRSGRTALAEQYFLEALTILQDIPNKRSEGLVRLRLARIARRQGQQEATERYIHQALAIDREAQNPREEALAIATLGQFAHDQRQLTRAESFYKQALTLARDVKDPLSETIALNWLGRLAQDCGQTEEAEQYYQQSLTIVREVRNRLGESVVKILWGQLLQARGQIEEAKHYYQQSLAISSEIHDQRGVGTALLCIGQLHQAWGQIEEAKHHYEQSLTIAREVLDRRIEGIDLGVLGTLAQARGESEDAKHYYQQSLAIAREVQDQCSEARVLGLLGTLAQARGETGDAKHYYQQSLVIAQNAYDRRGEGLALSYLGQLFQTNAEDHFRRALDLLHEQDAIQYAQVALVFGTFLIEQCDRHSEGCMLIMQSTHLNTQMKLPGEKEARAIALQLGCREATRETPLQCAKRKAEKQTQPLR